MKIRTRLIAGILIIVTAAFYYLTKWLIDDVRPHYIKSMEETMIDAATILSSIISARLTDSSSLQIDDFRSALNLVCKRELNARVYDYTKKAVNIRVYVTDSRGIVIFDSDNGRDEGKDYSKWNDVLRTLQGKYGARSTRAIESDPATSFLYVASPILFNDKTIGVLTISKPSGSINLFVQNAKDKIVVAALIAALCVILLGVGISIWVTVPIRKLTRYALAVTKGEKVNFPLLGKNEIGIMGNAFEEMRQALEGKRYVEQYIQTLTHEIKSPLSAIRGAAELLCEDMPKEQHQRFVSNIHKESGRIQHIIDRLLQLSSVENRQSLKDIEEIDLIVLIEDIITSMSTAFLDKRLTFTEKPFERLFIDGERFLVRQAIINLIQNAAEFSPEHGTITINCKKSDKNAIISIADNGPGIPEYALEKIFDRFYSLPRPGTKQKSTGLGLSFVREVITLHNGSVNVTNGDKGGARAEVIIPLKTL